MNGPLRIINQFKERSIRQRNCQCKKLLLKVSLVRFKEYAKPNNFFLTLYQDKSMEYKEPPKIRVVVRKRPLT